MVPTTAGALPNTVTDPVSILTGGISFVPLQLTGEFLELAIVFFVLALVAALVGFRGIAGLSMDIARLFIAIFLLLAVVALLL